MIKTSATSTPPASHGWSQVFCAPALYLLGGLFGVSPALAQTPISSVIVYTDRAQITRTQTVDCKSGQAHFAGLPSTLDRKTLWAEVLGQPGAVQGITQKTEVTGARPQAKALQEQIQQIDHQLVAAQKTVEATNAVEQKLGSFRAHLREVWSRQALGRKPLVASWDAGLDLLRQQALAANQRRLKAQAQQRELQRQREELLQDLQQIERARRRTTFKVTALLRCTGRQPVHLSYVVPHATWKIAYQARLDPKKKKATLVAQAIVAQDTGEDWTAARLAVSTANLLRKNTLPQFTPIRVSAHERQEVRKVLTRRFEQREHLQAQTTSMKKEQAAARDARGPAPQPDLGLAMLLTASAKATVPSDGREVVVPLDRRSVTGQFVLESVPKLFPFVYRRVTLGNPFPFTMLPGPLEIYQGRSYVGQTENKLRAPGEPFALSLGVQHQIQVSRYVKKEKLKESGALGNKKQLLHRYTIQVGNWSKTAQRVQILENIPVSQQKDIVVTLGDDATSPTTWNKEDGILTYKIVIPPRRKHTLVVSYVITVPDAYVVSGY